MTQWDVESVVTRRGRDGWFLVTWKPMRVRMCNVAAVRRWEGRPFAGEVEEVGDGTVVITFAQSWLPARDLGADWLKDAENRFKYSCPECDLILPTKHTLQSHWDATHAPTETVYTARERGLKTVDKRGAVHMKRHGKRMIRKYISQYLRRRVGQAELGVAIGIDFDDAAFYLLCLLPGAHSVRFSPVSGQPTNMPILIHH